MNAEAKTNAQFNALAARVNEIAEEHAAMKAAIMDERWSGVTRAIEDFNAHLKLIYERIERLERAVSDGVRS